MGKTETHRNTGRKTNAPPQKTKEMRFIIASTVSLLFLVTASIFILQQSKVPRRVFDTLFLPCPVAFYDTPSQEVAKMLELYRTKNYLNVVKKFDGLTTRQKDTLLLYKAVSQLAANNIHPHQAFTTFQTLERLEAAPKDLLYWYKALALIKMRYTEAAKIELRYIIATNSNYRGRALEALRMLE